jgi:hypothetical protein
MHPTENTEITAPAALLRTRSFARGLALVLPLALPLALGACAADPKEGAGTVKQTAGNDDADGNDGADGNADTSDTDAPPEPT